MFSFILNLTLMLSLGTLLFMVVRVLPRIDEGGKENVIEKRSAIERWLVSEIPEKADIFLSNWLAKWVGKIRVFILKMDNLLGDHLKRLKPKNGKGESLSNGFKEIIEGDKEL